MRNAGIRSTVLVAVVAFGAIIVGVTAPTVMAEELKAPQPAVPELFTIEGEFVRIAYNNEGFASLGYRVANDSVTEQWMLLELGLTLQKGVKSQTLKRGAISLQMPDGSTIAMAGQKEFNEANLRALDRRASFVRDSINYFPASANVGCTMNFFADSSTPGRGLAYDEVSLNYQRACVGRIYFQIPDGIETGQYFVNIKLENSALQVPFRVFTKAEEKEFSKKWKSLKKEHEAQYKEEAKGN